MEQNVIRRFKGNEELVRSTCFCKLKKLEICEFYLFTTEVLLKMSRFKILESSQKHFMVY